MGRARQILEQRLVWLEDQRDKLKIEAEAILESATSAANSRIYKLRKKLLTSRQKADEQELLVGGRTVPRLGTHAVFAGVRGSQVELIDLEKSVKRMEDIVVRTFSLPEGKDTPALDGSGLQEGGKSMLGSNKLNLAYLSRLSRATHVRVKKPKEVLPETPDAAAARKDGDAKETWEAKEKRRLAAQNALALVAIMLTYRVLTYAALRRRFRSPVFRAA